MSRRRLILIRHSQSRPVPGVAPSMWGLTDLGRERCALLANHLRSFDLKKINCSRERKAVETAELAAARLGVPVAVADGVHEHVRTGAPYLSHDAFTAMLQRFFAEPEELVFGAETAQDACRRFTRAAQTLVARQSHGDVAIVTHGTVLSLFAGANSSWQPYDFWKKLGQPAVIVFDVPSFTLAQATFTV
ncbi:MAG: histidine phosphatase family protein [Chloroflexota bacterium]